MEHPVIRNLERTGTPDGREPIDTSCPICDFFAEKFYIRDGVVIGCNECIEEVDAVEYLMDNAAEEAWMYG